MEWALVVAAGLLAIPVLVFAIEVLASLLPYAARDLPSGARPRVAVMVPAHNEALVISPTIASIAGQLLPGDTLLVVADNCEDDTAAIARAGGAMVVERFDTRLRGKGYALDFGVRALAANPPDVLVIVDADCVVAPGTIDLLARKALAHQRPVQGLSLMRAPAGAGIGVRIAEFAWLVKNKVRPLGCRRLGVPCQLMGTGMALPWRDVRAASFATGHITEDMLFGLNLARAGTPPLFCPGGAVFSEFPVSEEGGRSQRRRWEHGHLGLLLTGAPGLLAAGLRQRRPALVGMALDLAVPPLALLSLCVGALAIVAGAGVLLGGTRAPLVAALALAGVLIASVAIAWLRFGRQTVTLAQLACAPLYVLRKVPVYLGFLTRRQTEWVRTRRGE